MATLLCAFLKYIYCILWYGVIFKTFGQKTSPSISKQDLSPKWLASARRSPKVKNLSCENGIALFSVHVHCTNQQKMSKRIRKFYLLSMYVNVVRDLRKRFFLMKQYPN
jgi:hypothetical protein